MRKCNCAVCKKEYNKFELWLIDLGMSIFCQDRDIDIVSFNKEMMVCSNCVRSMEIIYLDAIAKINKFSEQFIKTGVKSNV
ncbi:MAG: hypothetical protein AABY32_01840 [Nanoarchaeota archaeon]